MSANPYEAPKTKVADVAETFPMDRPKAIVLATKLLWVELLLNVVLVPIEYRRDPVENGTPLYFGIVGFFLALSLVLILAIWDGRNWSRWTFLVLFALFVVLFSLFPEELIELPPLEMALNLFIAAIDVGVSYLLFTRPGALWFQRKRVS